VPASYSGKPPGSPSTGGVMTKRLKAGGGTSAATPIWAAGMALVNQALLQKYHVFFAGPLVFYYVANHAGHLSPYYDVTQGSNLGFNAAPGWDFATGLGTPNLVDFYNVLAGVASGH